MASAPLVLVWDDLLSPAWIKRTLEWFSDRKAEYESQLTRGPVWCFASEAQEWLDEMRKGNPGEARRSKGPGRQQQGQP